MNRDVRIIVLPPGTRPDRAKRTVAACGQRGHPYMPNTDQVDTHKDGMGEACTNDRDGVPTVLGGQTLDDCPDTPNADQADGDGIGDACEARPAVTGPDASQDVAGDATDVRASASLAGVLVWAGSGLLLLVAAVTVLLLGRDVKDIRGTQTFNIPGSVHMAGVGG